MLNHEMDSCVLVKGWKKGAAWSFPRGKINKDEDDLDCAVREVWEETGFDLKAGGLVPQGSEVKDLEVNMREQNIRLFVFRDVPMDTIFETQTRKEISKIQWYKLSDLPAYRKKADATGPSTNKFYMVAPFLSNLKKWIALQKKNDSKKGGMPNHRNTHSHYPIDEAPTEDDSWPQANAGTAPVNGGTLEGATHELQRLLKVQPPTQGVQPPIQNTQSQPSLEDKASALLSMLQVGRGPAVQNQSNAQMPHTPLDLTIGQAPQPPNPHHQSNQHHMHINANQPPPPFPIHQNQNQPGYQWNAAQGHRYKQQHPGVQQAPLVHPQPLPPQVQLQRAMFNRSTFQENPPLAQNMRPQQQQDHGHTGQMPPPQQQPQQHPQQQGASLNGKSRALLDAFKKDPFNGQDQARNEPTLSMSFGKVPDLRSISQQPQMAESPQGPPIHPTGANPVSNAHRSALLGMFKSGASPEVLKATQAPTIPQPQPQRVLDGKQKSLLSALRGAYTEASATIDPASQAAYSAKNTGAALSNFLALKPQHDQLSVPKTRPAQASNASAKRQTAANQSPAQAQAQPIRILQRGQAPEHLNFGMSPSELSLRGKSPYSEYQPQTGSLGAGSMPSPGTSFQRPEQKRQLLSLFGSQPKQPGLTGLQTGLATEGTRTSSRGGSQTPISPAHQTFLLDYLQSVTNNASR